MAAKKINETYIKKATQNLVLTLDNDKMYCEVISESNDRLCYRVELDEETMTAKKCQCYSYRRCKHMDIVDSAFASFKKIEHKITEIETNQWYIVNSNTSVWCQDGQWFSVGPTENAIEIVKAHIAPKRQESVKVAKPVASPKVASESQHYVMSEALWTKLASLSEEKPVEVVEETKVIEETQSAPGTTIVSPEITEETSDIDIEQEVAHQLSLLKSAKIDSLRWIAYKRGIVIKSRTRKALIDAIIASVRAKLEQKEAIAA
jgi:hypothetical protein